MSKPEYFNATSPSREPIQTKVISKFEYFGHEFVFHKSIGAKKRGQYSVSHRESGILISGGFHYSRLKDAIPGTQLYLDVVGKEMFDEVIKKEMESRNA